MNILSRCKKKKKKVPLYIQTYTNIQISFIYTTRWLMSSRERLQNGVRMEEYFWKEAYNFQVGYSSLNSSCQRRRLEILFRPTILPNPSYRSPSLLSLAIFCPPSCSTSYPPSPSVDSSLIETSNFRLHCRLLRGGCREFKGHCVESWKRENRPARANGEKNREKLGRVTSCGKEES